MTAVFAFASPSIPRTSPSQIHSSDPTVAKSVRTLGAGITKASRIVPYALKRSRKTNQMIRIFADFLSMYRLIIFFRIIKPSQSGCAGPMRLAVRRTDSITRWRTKKRADINALVRTT